MSSTEFLGKERVPFVFLKRHKTEESPALEHMEVECNPIDHLDLSKLKDSIYLCDVIISRRKL